MIRFSCPKCKMVLQAAAEQAGATVGCPRCKFQMKVPATTPAATATAPAATCSTSAGWYLTRDGKKVGPHSASQLKQLADSGQLLPADMVLEEGTTTWVPASEVVQAFTPAINTTPPPPLSKPATADRAEWYYSQNGQQTGPVPWAQLRHLAASSQLRPTDMVWKAGMPAWAAVDSIQNLCPARPAVPTPPPCPPSPVTGSPPLAIPKHKSKSNVSILGRLTGTLSKLLELANTVREGYGWTVAAVVGSSALLPVIGDFFRPIASFNFLIFLTCSLVALSLLILFVKRPKTLNYPLGGACLFSGVMALGFGGWWALALLTGGQDRGFLAENVAFIDRLQAATVSVQAVDTSKLVEEEMVKRSEQQKRHDADLYAAALLEKTLEDFPKQVMEATVPGGIEKDEGSGSAVKVKVKVRFENDIKIYDDLTAKVKRRLEKIALKTGECTLVSTPQGKTWLTVPGTFESRMTLDENVVLLNTHRSSDHQRTEWNYYVVPSTCDFSFARQTFEVKLSFLSKSGTLVAVDRFEAEQGALASQPESASIFQAERFNKARDGSGLSPLYPYTPGTLEDLEWVRGGMCPIQTPLKRSSLLISPYYFSWTIIHGKDEFTKQQIRLAFSPAVEIERVVSLSLDELKQVATVKCELLH